jgi:hypothetical protein
VLSTHWKAGGRLWSLTSTDTLMYSSSNSFLVPLWPGVSSCSTPCAPLGSLRQRAPSSIPPPPVPVRRFGSAGRRIGRSTQLILSVSARMFACCRCRGGLAGLTAWRWALAACWYVLVCVGVCDHPAIRQHGGLFVHDGLLVVNVWWCVHAVVFRSRAWLLFGCNKAVNKAVSLVYKPERVPVSSTPLSHNAMEGMLWSMGHLAERVP